MKQILISIGVLFLFATIGFAQPRPIEASSKSGGEAPVAPLPPSIDVKYEGGMFGYDEKEDGTLEFDDEGERLIFYGKNQKEKFHIPYGSVLVIYPQSKSVTPTAGSVVSALPLPGAGLAGLLKEKRRYMIVHFDDPDIESAKGVINFKLASKEILDAMLLALAEKARLTQRGDAYHRSKKVKNL